MYRREYVKDKFRVILNRKKNFYHSTVFGLGIFLLIAFIVAPVMHEGSHILVLKVLGCHYNINLFFSLAQGVYAYINPWCGMSPLNSLVFFASGITVNVCISVLLFGYSWVLLRRWRLSQSIIVLFAALGFSVNPVLYFFETTGDILNMTQAIGIGFSSVLSKFMGACMLIAGSVYLFFHLEASSLIFHKMSESIREVESFIDDDAADA